MRQATNFLVLPAVLIPRFELDPIPYEEIWHTSALSGYTCVLDLDHVWQALVGLLFPNLSRVSPLYLPRLVASGNYSLHHCLLGCFSIRITVPRNTALLCTPTTLGLRPSSCPDSLRSGIKTLLTATREVFCFLCNHSGTRTHNFYLLMITVYH